MYTIYPYFFVAQEVEQETGGLIHDCSQFAGQILLGQSQVTHRCIHLGVNVFEG